MDNYEAFSLDYLEGNLTEEQKRELFLFLEQHPGLRENLEEYEEVRLHPGDISFQGKSRLKKRDFSFASIDETNVEEAIIAYWEGDLSAEQRKQVENYISRHPGRGKDFRVYGRLFLKPGEEVFPGKDRLFRKDHAGVFTLWRLAAAAVIVIAMLTTLFRAQLFRKTEEIPVTASVVNKIVSPEKDIRNPVTEPEKKTGETVAELPENLSKQKPPGVVHKREEVNLQATLLTHCPVITDYVLPVTVPVPDLTLDMEKINHQHDENILTLAEYASLKIKKNVLKEDTITTPRLNARDVILLGVKGINSLTGLNIHVQKEKDQSEDKEIFALSSRFFSYTRVRPAEKK